MTSKCYVAVFDEEDQHMLLWEKITPMQPGDTLNIDTGGFMGGFRFSINYEEAAGKRLLNGNILKLLEALPEGEG